MTTKQKKVHSLIFKIGDNLICLDGTDSHGLLKKNRNYKVVDTDGIRVQLEDTPLTWANTRFIKY